MNINLHLWNRDLKGSIAFLFIFKSVYRVIQERRSMFWEVLVPVIKKKVRMNMCLILSGYRDTACWICRYQDIASDNKERTNAYC